MSLIFILIIIAGHSAAVCLPLLCGKEVQTSNSYPRRIWKWNRNTKKFDLLEGLKGNGTAVCNVEYFENISGKEIIVSGDPMPPYMIVNDDGTLTGYIGDIWTTLEDTLKFRTVYKKPQHSAGPSLVRGEVHSWLAATTTSTYPTGFYSYSHQVATTYYGFFIMLEGTRVSKWWYTKIFSRGLWITAFSFIAGIPVLLLIMYRFKRAVCDNYIECNDELAGPSFNFLNVLGAVTGHGFQKFPSCWSLRVLVTSAVIMGMLISCGFNSTLTSFLAIRGKFLALNSLDDILQKKTHSVCVRDDSGAHRRLFEYIETYDPNNSTKWEGLVNKNCPDMYNVNEIHSKICKSGFVFLEALDIFLSIYREVQHRCDIVQIPGDYWSFNLVFLHATTSPHRRVIDNYLLRLRSAGILQRLERRWISREPPRSTNNWRFKPVEYGHIDLLLKGLLIMVLMSVLICVLENLWFTLQLKIKTKNRNRQLNDFPKFSYNFPANELDSISRRAWSLHV